MAATSLLHLGVVPIGLGDEPFHRVHLGVDCGLSRKDALRNVHAAQSIMSSSFTWAHVLVRNVSLGPFF